MIHDKFSLEKYVIKKGFSKLVVCSESGEKIFLVEKPFFRKTAEVYDYKTHRRPLFTINFKVKHSWKLTANVTCRYKVFENRRSLISVIDYKVDPLLISSEFKVMDSFEKETGVVKPVQMNYPPQYYEYIMGDKRVAVLYKASDFTGAYMLDLSGDKEHQLDKKIALTTGIVFCLSGLNLRKPGWRSKIDWDKPVVTGDDIYRIKKKQN